MNKSLTASSQLRTSRQSLPNTRPTHTNSHSPATKIKQSHPSPRNLLQNQNFKQRPPSLFSPNGSGLGIAPQDGHFEDKDSGAAIVQQTLSARHRHRQSLGSLHPKPEKKPAPLHIHSILSQVQTPKVMQPTKKFMSSRKPVHSAALLSPSSSVSKLMPSKITSARPIVEDREYSPLSIREDTVTLHNESKVFTGTKLSTNELDGKNTLFDAGSEINYRSAEKPDENFLTKSHFFFRKDGPHGQEEHYTSRFVEYDDGREKENRRYEGLGYKYQIEHEDQGHEDNPDTDRKELIDYDTYAHVSSEPISSNSFKKLSIPKFAHQLSHEKVYDSRSFERRVEKSPESLLPGEKAPEIVSIKSFYFHILKELEHTPLDIEHDGQVAFMLNKAEKVDQVTFSIVTERLGIRYSQGLYHIFAKYALSGNGLSRDKMNLSKLLNFAKDFNLFNRDLRQETVTLLFTKRCPTKIIDFPAFVDILFKMSRVAQPLSFDKHETTVHFQHYLDHHVLNQHNTVLEQLSPRHPRAMPFGKEYVAENEALRILEGHDELLKHIFTLYKSLDIQFSNNSIIKLKDFRNFCQDFSIVPVLANLNQMNDIFRRFQLQDKPVVDFRGFILALCSLANIGFEKDVFKQKFDTFSKKMIKFFDFLVEMSNRLSSQLIVQNLNKGK